LRIVPPLHDQPGTMIVLIRGEARPWIGNRRLISETFHLLLLPGESPYDTVLRAMAQSSVQWKKPRKVKTGSGSAISTTRG